MIIRATQQNVLSLNLFAKKLQNHWLENFADKFSVYPKDEVERLAHEAIREADSKGIENEDDIIIYSDLCVVNDSGFASRLKHQEISND